MTTDNSFEKIKCVTCKTGVPNDKHFEKVLLGKDFSYMCSGCKRDYFNKLKADFMPYIKSSKHEKECIDCLKFKAIKGFYFRVTNRDGLSNICRICAQGKKNEMYRISQGALSDGNDSSGKPTYLRKNAKVVKPLLSYEELLSKKEAIISIFDVYSTSVRRPGGIARVFHSSLEDAIKVLDVLVSEGRLYMHKSRKGFYCLKTHYDERVVKQVRYPRHKPVKPPPKYVGEKAGTRVINLWSKPFNGNKNPWVTSL